MLPAEIIKKIKAIHIRTNYLVNDVMAGEYTSVFKGRGMEFEEVREYHPGDEIRFIDWNVTARMGHPYVKEHREERELTVILAVDVSSSGYFGSVGRMKNEVSAEIAAILAYSAIKSNDKVGLLLFTDRVEKYIPPKKGRGHVWRVIREVIGFTPAYRGTDIKEVLDYLGRVLRRRSVCFLISDFLTEGYEHALRVSNKKHDVIAVQITDPRELNLPKVGIIELEDAETGETILLDTSSKRIRNQFRVISHKSRESTQEQFRSMNVDLIDIITDKSYIEPIMRFFRLREKRL